MAHALIVSGGWDGHKPFEVAEILTEKLVSLGVTVENSFDLNDFKRSADFDVVIPNWTMGEIEHDQAEALIQAVESGIGLAGIHGGMGDAFRSNTRYQFKLDQRRPRPPPPPPPPPPPRRPPPPVLPK